MLIMRLMIDTLNARRSLPCVNLSVPSVASSMMRPQGSRKQALLLEPYGSKCRTTGAAPGAGQPSLSSAFRMQAQLPPQHLLNLQLRLSVPSQPLQVSCQPPLWALFSPTWLRASKSNTVRRNPSCSLNWLPITMPAPVSLKPPAFLPWPM